MNIREVSLLSNSIRETKIFYVQVLGLKIVSENPATITLQAGQTTLIFYQTDSIDPTYHFAFNIPGNQLDTVMEWLQERLEIMPASENGDLITDFKSWNAKSFYFNDNNGNILECIARFDLQNNTPVFNPQTFILNISEIGFVVTNVTDAEKLLQEKGIPPFSKGPQLPDFSVLGDDNGLVILTDMNRGWMPNHLDTKPFWSKAVIQQNTSWFELSLTDHLQIKNIED